MDNYVQMVSRLECHVHAHHSLSYSANELCFLLHLWHLKLFMPEA